MGEALPELTQLMSGKDGAGGVEEITLSALLNRTGK